MLLRNWRKAIEKRFPIFSFIPRTYRWFLRAILLILDLNDLLQMFLVLAFGFAWNKGGLETLILLSPLVSVRISALNLIVWCYVCYYVWHYAWLNVVINKVFLLLSKIMVTWIFGHYHILHEMHNMWFMWFSHRRYRSLVLCKLIILVRSQWWNWAFHLRRL